MKYDPQTSFASIIAHHLTDGKGLSNYLYWDTRPLQEKLATLPGGEFVIGD
jgi:hypothetical protein